MTSQIPPVIPFEASIRQLFQNKTEELPLILHQLESNNKHNVAS